MMPWLSRYPGFARADNLTTTVGRVLSLDQPYTPKGPLYGQLVCSQLHLKGRLEIPRGRATSLANHGRPATIRLAYEVFVVALLAIAFLGDAGHCNSHRKWAALSYT